jgi:hypothetical protein
LLPFSCPPATTLVIPQQSAIALLLLSSSVLLWLSVLLFYLSFRSEAEKSAVAVAVALLFVIPHTRRILHPQLSTNDKARLPHKARVPHPSRFLRRVGM